MKLLEVARIGKAHGLNGQVSIHLISNVLERIESGSVLYLDDGREMRIKSSKQYKKHYLILFEGITSRTSVEAIVGKKLYGVPIDDPDTMWAHDLIGSNVTDRNGKTFGKVTAIETNPASDLLVLEGGAIIPLTFLVEYEDQVIKVDIPSGLIEEGTNED